MTTFRPETYRHDLTTTLEAVCCSESTTFTYYYDGKNHDEGKNVTRLCGWKLVLPDPAGINPRRGPQPETRAQFMQAVRDHARRERHVVEVTDSGRWLMASRQYQLDGLLAKRSATRVQLDDSSGAGAASETKQRSAPEKSRASKSNLPAGGQNVQHSTRRDLQVAYSLPNRECPSCGAGPGKPCVTAKGKPTRRPHESR